MRDGNMDAYMSSNVVPMFRKFKTGILIIITDEFCLTRI